MGKTLLLADDSVTMQKVVGITFANEDIDLVTVDNGDAALERAKAIRPDVVLADVGMPGLNGYELCEALKRDPALQHVRVILLTGTFDTYDEARARDVGADAHVSKPFEAQALVDQVHALLNAPRARVLEPAPTPAAERRAPVQAHVAPRPAPSRPAPPSMMETPELDFESLDLSGGAEETFAEALPDLDTGLDDFPAPASERAVDPNKTQFLDPRSALEAPDLMPATELEPDFNAGMKTTLLPPADSDLFGPIGESFDGPSFEEPDLSSSGVFGDPSEDDFGTDPTDTGFADIPNVEPPLGEDWNFDTPVSAPPIAAKAAATAPTFEPEPPFATSAEMIEESEDLELTPSEELPWADPLDGEEPVTPSYVEPSLARRSAAPPIPAAERIAPPSLGAELDFDAPDAMPAFEPLVPPSPAPRVTAAPEREQRPAARPQPPQHAVAPSSTTAGQRAAAAAPIDPAILRQALEKIAWEAFGPLSEQIVREVVKKVEAIAWETLPQIAERLVQEEIARLRGAGDASGD